MFRAAHLAHDLPFMLGGCELKPGLMQRERLLPNQTLSDSLSLIMSHSFDSSVLELGNV